MPAKKALILNTDSIEQCSPPDFIDNWHLNLGEIGLVYIDNGTITPVKSYTGALPGTVPPTNQIHTINGGEEGSIVVLRCQSASIIDNTGNLRIAGNFTMNHPNDTLTLLKTSSGTWLEIARANNG